MADVQGIKVGSKASFEKTVTEADIAKYTEVSGDANPLHADAEYAARTRFKAPIAHGMLGAGLISAALGTRIAPGAVVIYLAQSLRFRAPVSAGDTLTATVEATAVDAERDRVTLDTVVTNQEGAEVIIGEAQIMVEALS
ncbi:MAG: MaoC family dehydratase [Dehalococcoidia bacterium]|jgi:acyl dehydratase|nr:MaoC family dehydratase [Dehalococcoidia bacterium]